MMNTGERETHRSWLLEVCGLPTASGKEDRVIEWIRAWAAKRPDVSLSADYAGNLHLALEAPAWAGGARRPVYFTAHMDHPAFVVERVLGAASVEASFRGGVMADYFTNAGVAIHTSRGVVRGRVVRQIVPEEGVKQGPLKRYEIKVESSGGASGVNVGDVATWDLPAAEIKDGILHAPVCDDLAALVAAFAAFDVLRRVSPREDVRLLLTRAEEVGFVGAIASCRAGRPATMPVDARVIALENSRAMGEVLVGGGPIVRVGDRLSVFSPSLTEAIAARAEEHAAAVSGGVGAASPTATQKSSEMSAWRWQRRLMSGGACEASVFCASGYEATCVCLPLGNYHNMGDLDAVQSGTNTRPATIEREFISVLDFEGLVDLLIACGTRLPESRSLLPRFEKLWGDMAYVLGDVGDARA
ncbi:MAG: M20/M25/M40 family metallo-hydrolase [Phycisphaerales bacterium]|nr:MAG: M20/M25/M40 family metallo-hydrolase [Phycisphaerales bacterium]